MSFNGSIIFSFSRNVKELIWIVILVITGEGSERVKMLARKHIVEHQLSLNQSLAPSETSCCEEKTTLCCTSPSTAMVSTSSTPGATTSWTPGTGETCRGLGTSPTMLWADCTMVWSIKWGQLPRCCTLHQVDSLISVEQCWWYCFRRQWWLGQGRGGDKV